MAGVNHQQAAANAAKTQSWWRGVLGEEHVTKLDNFNYDRFIHQQVGEKPVLVMFYATWCGYSVNAKRGFAAAAEQLAIEGVPVYFAAVDCDISEEIRDRYREIAGYPSFIYFVKGSPVLTYNQQRTKDGFYNWVRRNQQQAGAGGHAHAHHHHHSHSSHND